MFRGSKYPSCGPVIEKELLANEANLNFYTFNVAKVSDAVDLL